MQKITRDDDLSVQSPDEGDEVIVGMERRKGTCRVVAAMEAGRLTVMILM